MEVGDKVRARIVAVSMSPEQSKEGKINLTMRQPCLGKFEWIEEERKKEKGGGKAKEAKEEETKVDKPKKGSKKSKKSGAKK